MGVDYHYQSKLLYMEMGMMDYGDGLWRIQELPDNGEARSYYAAGWSMALNQNLFSERPYGDLS